MVIVKKKNKKKVKTKKINNKRSSPVNNPLQNNFLSSAYEDGESVLSLTVSSSQWQFGAVHNVRHARGVWGPSRYDSLWQGEGVKSMWRHAYTFFIIHMEHEI